MGLRFRHIILSVSLVLLIFVAFPGNSAFSQSPSFSANLHLRKLQNGQSVSQRGEICYSPNGNFTVHFFAPEEYFLSVESGGRISVYDPENEQTRIIQAPWLQPESNFLFFFAHRKLSDLGLSEQGFTLVDAEYESPYEVTWWSPPANRAFPVEKIKLVHQAGKPVFLGYFHPEKGLFRKVYFSGEAWVGNSWFPENITTITLRPEMQDSVIEKAVYSNFLSKKQHGAPCPFSIPAKPETETD